MAQFIRGRPLDIRDPTQITEGATTEVFVSRLNIYADGMDEIVGGTCHDYSLPLEITFIGECARDLGGPRKEFLSSMLRQIQEKLFVESVTESGTFVLHGNIVAEREMYYLGAGIFFGKLNCTVHCCSYILIYNTRTWSFDHVNHAFRGGTEVKSNAKSVYATKCLNCSSQLPIANHSK